MQQKENKVPYVEQGGTPSFRRRMYEEEITYLQGEIVYLSEIKHPRHEYMIQIRKQRLAQIKEKMR